MNKSTNNNSSRIIGPDDFKTLTPYTDKELPVVLKRVTESPYFDIMLQRIWPDIDAQFAKQLYCSITSIDEFQHKVMMPTVMQLIKGTMDSFTVSGLEQLDKTTPYLYISNHRDITLDAALLCFALLRHGMITPEVSFGDNLIANDFVNDIARINRLFPVARGASRHEFYRSSLLMSAYIHHVLEEKQRSVWIAQRSGRTKDGDDRTEPGLLKMLSISSKADFVSTFSSLRIVPVSISYEYEPCALKKAHEMRAVLNGEVYKKAKGEDMLSIFEGILQNKGRVHLNFSTPISPDEIKNCATAPANSTDRNTPYIALSQLIDRRIWTGYKLFPLNKLAYDIVENQASPDILLAAKGIFTNDILLRIYANPVANYNKVQQEQPSQTASTN
ncbi:MAG: 1-acyl-sn-glycerol-3-phosphate acyltransferase [Bacteroidales bacterium]|nr:1-acyl-sn-glycerol-3-phosphate acyltransferase [Bacteroidales bacterium]